MNIYCYYLKQIHENVRSKREINSSEKQNDALMNHEGIRLLILEAQRTTIVCNLFSLAG